MTCIIWAARRGTFANLPWSGVCFRGAEKPNFRARAQASRPGNNANSLGAVAALQFIWNLFPPHFSALQHRAPFRSYGRSGYAKTCDGFRHRSAGTPRPFLRANITSPHETLRRDFPRTSHQKDQDHTSKKETSSTTGRSINPEIRATSSDGYYFQHLVQQMVWRRQRRCLPLENSCALSMQYQQRQRLYSCRQDTWLVFLPFLCQRIVPQGP